MPQTLTSIAEFWRYAARGELRLLIRIDHGVPGSHLIWDIENTGTHPVTLTKLIVRGQRGSAETVPFELPHLLAPQDRLVVPTDVDWSLLHAKSVAAVDVTGREYKAPRRQLATVREQMRAAIDRPGMALSASDFLSGAANLVFGVVILGLGFFMLMWAIAGG